MDHIVYLDSQSNELKNLLSGNKSLLIRGTKRDKLPYNRVMADDTLYFLNNNDDLIKAKAKVKTIFQSKELSVKESIDLVYSKLNETKISNDVVKKIAGKRYIVLIDTWNVEFIKPFRIDKSYSRNIDDWMAVGEINNIRVS